jgi:hypothetical protein
MKLKDLIVNPLTSINKKNQDINSATNRIKHLKNYLNKKNSFQQQEQQQQQQQQNENKNYLLIKWMEKIVKYIDFISIFIQSTYSFFFNHLFLGYIPDHSIQKLGLKLIIHIKFLQLL